MSSAATAHTVFAATPPGERIARLSAEPEWLARAVAHLAVRVRPQGD
jgi:hypothetical protein